MNQITPKIWIGNSHDASLHQDGINHILNCAHDLDQRVGWSSGVQHFHVGLVDGGNEPALYFAAVEVLGVICARDGAVVLVHCHEGRSRSVYIVACYLVKSGQFEDVNKAIEHIRKCGRDINVAQGHFDSFKP